MTSRGGIRVKSYPLWAEPFVGSPTNDLVGSNPVVAPVDLDGAVVGSIRSLIGAYGLRGSRIVNSLYSPTPLSTAIVPRCCCVTMS